MLDSCTGSHVGSVAAPANTTVVPSAVLGVGPRVSEPPEVEAHRDPPTNRNLESQV